MRRSWVFDEAVIDAIVDEAVGEDAQRLVRPEHRERLLIRDRIRPHAHTLHDLGLTQVERAVVRLGRDRLVLITWCWRSCG